MNIKYEDFIAKLSRVRNIPRLSSVENMLRSFSPGERLVFYLLSVVLALSTLALLAGLNASVSVSVPTHGGSLVEGIVGPPRFINPVLSVSQADEDLTQLVYSGLMHSLPDGSVAPSLAESYDISVDGMTYTFTLRKDAVFQDDTPVTSADVLFTVGAAQRPEIKSPRRADWEGVTVSAPDERTVIFKLQHAYAPFIENTTLGILPKHLWGSVTAEEFPFNPLNTHPIGSGPYKIASLQTDSTGAATSYTLSAFKKFLPEPPYLNNLSFRFYPNEESLIKAFNAREIDSLASISPAGIAALKRTDAEIINVPLPRVFGVFFNQSRATVFADASVRAALNAAVDKKAIVNEVLKGYGEVLEGPIPPGVLEIPLSVKASTVSDAQLAEKAREILKRGGWTFDEKNGTWKKKKQVLTFALSTSDAPGLSATANMLADYWRAAGIPVSVRIYPLSELNTTVIRPRAYDAILFGEVVGRTVDIFAFWHSSQRNDPGLNLAMYANTKADSNLALARATTNRKERERLYSAFAAIIDKDQPAVFLYSPDFIYVVPKNIGGISLGALTTPSERFLNVTKWYSDTERVWDFFSSTN